MENGEDTRNALQKSRRLLKRKSEEGSTTDSYNGGNVSQNESPKPRKYSRRIPPTDAERCIGDDKSIQIETKENTLISCQSPGYALKPSNGTTAKSYTRNRDRKKLLVPPLDGLSDHRGSSECTTGFILSPRADKPYQCHFCIKQFKYFSNLKSHMNIVHRKMIENSPKDSKTSTVGSGQVFQCEICLRNFKYFSNLRTHRLVHTSEVESCNSDIDEKSLKDLLV